MLTLSGENPAGMLGGVTVFGLDPHVADKQDKHQEKDVPVDAAGGTSSIFPVPSIASRLELVTLDPLHIGLAASQLFLAPPATDFL